MRFTSIASSLIVVIPLTLFSQDSDLAALQSKLTVDCKSIRGHASRIVAEASAPEFNHDVTMAHLEQVARYQEEMEKDLKATTGLLTPAQGKATEGEISFLSSTCQSVKKIVLDLRSLLSTGSPNTDAIRRLALKLKNDMTLGAETHGKLKRKLGIS